MQKRPRGAEQQIIDGKAVKLVPMNGEVTAALELPLVLLVHFQADQVRHDVAEPAIMVALHPDHFNATLGIGELADVAEELPVGLGQTAKVKVGKNVAQQDQAPETVLPQHPRGLLRAADLGPQVQVREDERVIDGGTHHPSCNKRMLRGDENCTTNSAVTNIEIVTNYVGADVLICPAEQSSAISLHARTCRASLDWADEDICPYVVRGG